MNATDSYQGIPSVSIGNMGPDVQLTDWLNFMLLLPHWFIWLVTPGYLLYLHYAGKKIYFSNRTTRIRFGNNIILIFTTVVMLKIYDLDNSPHMGLTTSIFPYAMLVKLASLVLITVLEAAERRRGFNHSLPSFVFWLLTSSSEIIILSTEFFQETPASQVDNLTLPPRNNVLSAHFQI